MCAATMQGLRQLTLAPGLVVRCVETDRLHCGVPTGGEGDEQLALPYSEQAQHAIIDGQFALALEFAQQAVAIVPGGLDRKSVV